VEKLNLRAEVSAHSYESQESEDHILLFGKLDNFTPRGRTRDVKITENASPTMVTKAPRALRSSALSEPRTLLAKDVSPTPQVSCGRSDNSGSRNGLAGQNVDSELTEDSEQSEAEDVEEKVSLEELTQLVRDMEALESALQKAKQENIALRRDKVMREEAWELALQRLQRENAALREENAREVSQEAGLQKAQQEIDALREQKLAQEQEMWHTAQRHARDVAELEGMLEPVMAENSQLRTALQAAEAQLEARSEAGNGYVAYEEARSEAEPEMSPREAEPEIERSCDIDRVLNYSCAK